MKKLIVSLLLTLSLAPVFAEPAEVQVTLDYRIKPNRDNTTKTISQTRTTMRVVEDRGIVAKSQGRLSAQPLQMDMAMSSTSRMVSGLAVADGSFDVEMQFPEDFSSISVNGGPAKRMPPSVPAGAKASARVDRDGRLLANSIRVSGVPSSEVAMLTTMLSSILEQALSMPPLVLTPGVTVPQEMTMQIPMPMMGALQIKLVAHNRLLSVEDGVASIEVVYTMEFGLPAKGVEIKAEGSGGGTMRYDVQRAALLSHQTRQTFTAQLSMADGVIEMKMNQDMKVITALAQ